MTNARNMTPEEQQAFVDRRYEALVTRGIERGHFYNMTADGIMLNDRPDYAQAYYDGLQGMRAAYIGTPEKEAAELVVESLGHLPMYILYGWETGIYNEFRHFQGRGFTKANIMEMVLYAQLSAGIRGLQLVYNAVSKLLVDFVERPVKPAFPEGWAPDPDAFKAGLDLSVRPLTDQDRTNVEEWYERNVGYVPDSAAFAMTYHPEFYKWHRARWEIIFQTLPKQVMPYIMLRQNMIAGNPAALREAVLLGTLPMITASTIDLLNYCKTNNETLLVTAMDADMTVDQIAAIPERLLIVFGSEKDGCSPEIEAAATMKVRIPISDKVESLNVSASAGITLFNRIQFNRKVGLP